MADRLILWLSKARAGWRPSRPSGFISQASHSQPPPRLGLRGPAAALGQATPPSAQTSPLHLLGSLDTGLPQKRSRLRKLITSAASADLGSSFKQAKIPLEHPSSATPRPPTSLLRENMIDLESPSLWLPSVDMGTSPRSLPALLLTPILVLTSCQIHLLPLLLTHLHP